MLKIWTDEFLSTVLRINPNFIALHCQEVGGKNYENSMKHVQEFVTLLMSSNELKSYDKVRIFLDEDYSSAENFTVSMVAPLNKCYSAKITFLLGFRKFLFHSPRRQRRTNF